MTSKKSYWLTDGYGTAAQVEGAEERDRWLPLGWQVIDDEDALTGATHVWLKHEGHGGRQRFPVESVELWQAKGWQPSDPPPPSDPFNAPAPADVAGPVIPPTESSEPAPSAKKEK